MYVDLFSIFLSIIVFQNGCISGVNSQFSKYYGETEHNVYRVRIWVNNVSSNCRENEAEVSHVDPSVARELLL